MKLFPGLVMAVVALAMVTGCSKSPSDSGTAAATKMYDVKGKVVSVDAKKPSVTLDHEDIPGLMRAMTMEFRIVDAKLLDGIAPGDTVRGQLRKDEAGYLLLGLVKQ